MKVPCKLKTIWKWYICGYYHCDKCKYSWEERSYEGDADAGCYIRGDIYDICRLIPPFKNIVGWFAKRKYEYWEGHRYDGVSEWYEDEERKERVIEKVLKECGMEREPSELSTAIAVELLEYESKNRKEPVNPWKAALKYTVDKRFRWLKPYLPRRKRKRDIR